MITKMAGYIQMGEAAMGIPEESFCVKLVLDNASISNYRIREVQFGHFDEKKRRQDVFLVLSGRESRKRAIGLLGTRFALVRPICSKDWTFMVLTEMSTVSSENLPRPNSKSRYQLTRKLENYETPSWWGDPTA